MAREGADITIVHLEAEQEDADEAKSMVEKEGVACQTIAFDLTDLHGCKKVVDKHIEKYGRVDVLVNNASKQVQEGDFAKIDLGQYMLLGIVEIVAVKNGRQI
jgi:NAD(P)-dependent dehydrogenase (short-subunit alcohol dehydrogenase family)